MKRKNYQKPTLDVTRVLPACVILSGSHEGMSGQISGYSKQSEGSGFTQDVNVKSNTQHHDVWDEWK